MPPWPKDLLDFRPWPGHGRPANPFPTRTWHRAMRAWWIAVALLLAGCTGPSDGPLVDDDPAPPPVPDHVQVETPEPTVDARYVVDQAGLDYEDAFVRTTLTADGPTEVHLVWEGQLVPVSSQGGCFAGAVHHDRGVMALTMWTLPADLGVKARAAGMSVDEDTYPDDTTGSGDPVPFEGTMHVSLEPGETLVMDLGGDSTQLFAVESPQGERSRSRMTLDVTGEHRLEAADGGALMCGRGADRADGSTAGVGFYMLDAELGGHVGLTATEAATAWIVHGNDQADSNAYTVRFLDEDPQPLGEEFRRSSAQAGTMELGFDRSIGLVDGGVLWLFVDADWQLE